MYLDYTAISPLGARKSKTGLPDTAKNKIFMLVSP